MIPVQNDLVIFDTNPPETTVGDESLDDPVKPADNTDLIILVVVIGIIFALASRWL